MDAVGFRVLSVDGGGIRGAFAAGFLAAIERRLGKPVCEYFDLIAGTSTGGIIAAALALGEPAEAIERFYRNRGPSIFQRDRTNQRASWPIGVCLWFAKWKFPAIEENDLDVAWLLQPKYRSERLCQALVEFFGERTIDHAIRRLVVPAVNLTRGKTVVFKTPHLPGLFRDKSIRIADVVLATTAAPTYFAHAVIGEGSAYVDGGLWANNPAMVAYTEATAIRTRCKRPGIDQPFEENGVRVVSVGTGSSPFFVKPPPDRAGIFFWSPRLMEVMWAAQSQAVNFQAEYFLGNRYQRIDFQIPDRGWRLDGAGLIEELIHLGKERAAETFARLEPEFFTNPAPRFVPF